MNAKILASKAFAAAAFLAMAASVHAQLIGISGSTQAPSSVYGGYSMTVFGNDLRPDYGQVSDVATPVGGTVGFGKSLVHYDVGAGWLTWSNNYTGDVYSSNGTGSLTLTLPNLTKAFYFYAESDLLGNHVFTVTSGNAKLTETVNGNGGAELFAFYGLGATLLSSITIKCDDPLGFAVGEFGISRAAPVPEPGTYAIIGAAGLIGLSVARRIRKKTA